MAVAAAEEVSFTKKGGVGKACWFPVGDGKSVCGGVGRVEDGNAGGAGAGSVGREAAESGGSWRRGRGGWGEVGR